MKSEAVEFGVESETLKGNLYSPDDSPKNLAVLFLHGWTGSANERCAAYLASQGFRAMTFSLSGHNSSSGRIEDQTRQKSLKEVLAAYDLFAGKVDCPIVAVGNSYGGYMACLLSAERSLKSLSLRVPANYPDEDFDELQLGQGGDDPSVLEWRRQELSWQTTKALAALHNFNGSVQIIEAGEDERVPHQSVQNYVAAITDKSQLDYHFMKDWPHSLGTDEDRNKQFESILLNWLSKQL